MSIPHAFPCGETPPVRRNPAIVNGYPDVAHQSTLLLITAGSGLVLRGPDYAKNGAKKADNVSEVIRQASVGQNWSGSIAGGRVISGRRGMEEVD